MSDRTLPSFDAHEAQQWMRRALALAELGQGLVEPNPMVGCVIVDQNGCVSEGYHQRYGGPHAEVEALRAASDPNRLRGATAYVTLEPCCHHGKTPPCTEALLEAGIARVVIAMRDPFPQVDGGGLKRLRDQGVDIVEDVLRSEAQELNAPYLKLTLTGVPWVIAKWAMTIDGRIATRTRNSQWITGESARAEVHRLRGRVDVIATGMGTVVADDPKLTARPAGPRTARRVVYCHERLPSLESQLIRSIDEGPVDLVVGPRADHATLNLLKSAGASLIRHQSDDPIERVNESLKHFGQRRVTNFVVEGGSRLLGTFFDTHAVDECHVYIGPRVFGGVDAPAAIGGHGVELVENAEQYRLLHVDQFDEDVRMIYRRTS